MTSMVKSDEAVDEDELSLVTGEAKLLFKTADILLSWVSDEGRARLARRTRQPRLEAAVAYVTAPNASRRHILFVHQNQRSAWWKFTDTVCSLNTLPTTLANSLRGHGDVVAAASASVSMKPHEREIEKNLSNLVVSKPAAVRRVPFVIQIAFLSPLLLSLPLHYTQTILLIKQNSNKKSQLQKIWP